MFFKKILLISFSILLLNSCGTKEYNKVDSLYITFKTPTFKYADLGFRYINNDNMKIEIYSSGSAIMNLNIKKEQICTSTFKCLDKNSFNKRVLSSYYPKDILNHIFRGEVIFGGKNVIKRGNGFTQKIDKEDKYSIRYSVLNNQIIFDDKINNILIKIKRLDR